MLKLKLKLKFLSILSKKFNFLFIFKNMKPIIKKIELVPKEINEDDEEKVEIKNLKRNYKS